MGAFAEREDLAEQMKAIVEKDSNVGKLARVFRIENTLDERVMATDRLLSRKGPSYLEHEAVTELSEAHRTKLETDRARLKKWAMRSDELLNEYISDFEDVYC